MGAEPPALVETPQIARKRQAEHCGESRVDGHQTERQEQGTLETRESEQQKQSETSYQPGLEDFLAHPPISEALS